MHRSRLAFALFAFALVAPVASAQISIAGYSFDDLAGPDAVILQPGGVPQFAGVTSNCLVVETLPGQTAAESATTVFLDDTLDAWMFSKARVRLDFLDNVVVNGPGADLVVFELGGAEAFELSVFVESLCQWSAPRIYTPTSTGFSQNLCGGITNAINTRNIDLSDFGVPAGAVVRRVLIDNKGVYGGVVGADLAQVMALHSAAPSALLSNCLLEFQQGLDTGGGPYLGARDTCLASDFPTTNFNTVALEYSDTDPEHNLLFRFEGLVGAGLDQVPPGAVVSHAELTLSTGAGAAASTGPHNLHRVLQAWNPATVTWANSFGGDGVDANGVEVEVSPLATFPSLAANSSVTLDVTAAVQAWANGAPNRGFALLAATTDGLGVQLSEAGTPSVRPALRVQLANGLGYAGAVLSFAPVVNGGSPAACNLDPTRALGAPDHVDAGAVCCTPVPDAVSLGSGGSIALEFTSVSVSGDGSPEPDLWIFEVGPDVEDTYVDLSTDGISWVPVGKVLGATSSIDLDAFGVGPLDLFRYVRLTDDPLEGDTAGCSPGADIDAVAALTPNPWVNLGFGLAGSAGVPQLSAAGALEGGGQVQVQLLNARPSSAAHAFAGISQIYLPFKGGVLVPAPDIMILNLPTSPAGKLSFAPTWPTGVPAGITFTMQLWVTDPVAVRGYAASNAISSVTQ